MRRAKTVLELLVVVLVVAILMSLTVTSVGYVRGSQRQAHCANNMRQLGTAVGSYAITYYVLPNWNWVSAEDHWATQIQAHCKNKEVLVCPNMPKAYKTPGGDDASYRASCNRRNGEPLRPDDYSQPRRTMWLDEALDSDVYCTQPGRVWPDYPYLPVDTQRNKKALERHQGKAQWLMADGSVQAFMPTDARFNVSYRPAGEIPEAIPRPPPVHQTQGPPIRNPPLIYQHNPNW